KIYKNFTALKMIVKFSHSNVIYTRWGRKSCNNNTGAQLLYEGIAGGSHYSHSGGGANYICLPKVPDYLSTANPPYESYLYGAEYQYVNNIFPSKHDHNVPCARNAVYECVDKDAESIYGSSGNIDGALFYFVQGTCTGLPCPPYVNNRVITCVVCTK
ncbi:uncharacterized protein LOC121366519, partial [Gigantopelta aegis]|uniref:uncharacterized protein LOC121366519 n=1 Tax=Gigantopelta aegis TaxID=1735272 RepID=UPI001B88AAFD